MPPHNCAPLSCGSTLLSLLPLAVLCLLLQEGHTATPLRLPPPLSPADHPLHSPPSPSAPPPLEPVLPPFFNTRAFLSTSGGGRNNGGGGDGGGGGGSGGGGGTRHHSHQLLQQQQHQHGGPSSQPRLVVNNETSKAFLGEEADIACTLYTPGEHSVSWMRQVGELLELITYDEHTYANDDRYSLHPTKGPGWKRWRLHISSTKLSDAGAYRCRVGTNPPLVGDAHLEIVAPRTRVVDDRGADVSEQHYYSGSMIQLKCLVDRVPLPQGGVFPPGRVTWRRGTAVLTFNTSSGGVSIRADPATHLVTSRLYVANATPRDSGLYSCWYQDYAHDNVTVHVIAGEYPAAMQHDSLPEGCAGSCPVLVGAAPATLPDPLLLLPLLFVAVSLRGVRSLSMTETTWKLKRTLHNSVVTAGSAFIQAILVRNAVKFCGVVANGVRIVMVGFASECFTGNRFQTAVRLGACFVRCVTHAIVCIASSIICTVERNLYKFVRASARALHHAVCTAVTAVRTVLNLAIVTFQR